MDRLSNSNLSNLRSGIDKPTYKRNLVSSGIVHFGSGNFHRAHQAVYCDLLLKRGDTDWGITGISLRSSTMRDNLAPQDYFYTQATLGETTTFCIMGAIQKLLVAPENPQSVIEQVAKSETQLVTTTITEKGYYLSKNQINFEDPDIINDIHSLDKPKTVYGYIAAALIIRSQTQRQPLTILCCDNISGGGEHLMRGVIALLKIHSNETINWVNENVAFASSMVDRVTPATDEKLKKLVAEATGLTDEAPVAAEPFSQWIIEDNFAGKRPPFDQVGAIFVDDISPFEYIKLRFLNAGHSMLATLGYLAGDRFVHEALQRPTLAQFTELALKSNVLPVTTIPESVNGEEYIEQALARFRNQHLPYAVLQVGTDSSQKIQQRWLPSIDDALKQNKDYRFLAFSLSSWVYFILKALTNNELNDPLEAHFSDVVSSNSDDYVTHFLKIANAERFSFFANEAFMSLVENYYLEIGYRGIEQAITHFNQSIEESLL